MRELIADLNLDMAGLVALTEAASGNHVFTPLIATMANAERVIVVTKDSKYGKAKDIMENTLGLFT